MRGKEEEDLAGVAGVRVTGERVEKAERVEGVKAEVMGPRVGWETAMVVMEEWARAEGAAVGAAGSRSRQMMYWLPTAG